MATPILTDEILVHQLDLLRLSSGTARDVLALLNKLQRELSVRLAVEDITTATKARLEQVLREVQATITGYYQQISTTMSDTLTGVGEVQAGALRSVLSTLSGVERVLPTEAFLARLVTNTLIQGAPSAKWWARQAANVAFKFATQVRAGVTQGETTEQIVRRIVGSTQLGVPSVMDIARRDARALVHTSIQTVANEARMKTYEGNGDIIECIIWLATLDPKTCMICAAHDMHAYALGTRKPLDGGPPWGAGPGALHWNDRCVATIRMKPLKGAPKPPVGERASVDGPVRGNTSFADFLQRKGPAFADEVLGPGRAQLWREGKLTLEQLLNLSGNPLTMKQLRAKYG